jgi:3-oxoacyl-[acyl-carrier-protein] synthase-3
MVYARIAGTANYLPERVLTNADLEKMLKDAHPDDPSQWTNNEWIIERTGIETRRIARPDESPGSMGGISTEKSLEDAKTDARDLGMIICCTNTRKKDFPPSAAQIHAYVKAPITCGIMDIQAGCTSFTTGLQVADGLIRAGIHKTIALVGADKMSDVVDYKDRKTSILFGDLACTWILKAGDKPGIVPIPGGGLYCDSQYRGLITLNDQYKIEMDGRKVFELAVEVIPDTILNVLEKTNYTLADVKMVAPHNANGRIITACIRKLAKKTGIPEKEMEEKFYHKTREYGNTSAGSSANCIHEARKQGIVKEGDLIVKVDMGAGFTWGVSVMIL